MTNGLTLHPKVSAALLASSVVVLIIYSLAQWAHVTLPDTASAALTVIVTFIAGWLAPSPEPAPVETPPPAK